MRGANYVVILAIAVSSACSSNDVQVVHVRSVAFELPAGWSRTEVVEPGATSIVWTPVENDRKESIAIIYSDENAAVAMSGTATLQRLMAIAQTGLPNVRASNPAPLTTMHGLSGVSQQLEFVPLESTAKYYRSHAVFSDGKAMVHVLYTARSPDASRETFNAVLRTIHHEEG
jgi:hypothetical protein